jgi:hypothetical protein
MEVMPDLHVDFSSDGGVVGYDVQNASRMKPAVALILSDHPLDENSLEDA